MYYFIEMKQSTLKNSIQTFKILTTDNKYTQKTVNFKPVTFLVGKPCFGQYMAKILHDVMEVCKLATNLCCGCCLKMYNIIRNNWNTLGGNMDDLRV